MDVIDSIRWLFDDLMQRFFSAPIDSAGRRADCQRDGRVVSEETAWIHRDSEDEHGLKMAWNKIQKKLNHL